MLKQIQKLTIIKSNNLYSKQLKLKLTTLFSLNLDGVFPEQR